MAEYTAARCGLVSEELGLAIVDPIPALDLSGLAIVLRPFEPSIRIETVLIRSSAQPPSQIAEHLMRLLRAERDELKARKYDPSGLPKCGALIGAAAWDVSLRASAAHPVTAASAAGV